MAEQITLTVLVGMALERIRRMPVPQDEAVETATALHDVLSDYGFAVHKRSLCIRPGDPAAVGRPMTEAEMTMVGLRR